MSSRDDDDDDQFGLECRLREAREFVLIETAGLSLISTSAVADLARLFDRSPYEPSLVARMRPHPESGRRSVYRELSNNDLVDHAFWMARRFFPDDLAAQRLYVMLSVKIFFHHFGPDVQPKALEHLVGTPPRAPSSSPPSSSSSTTTIAATPIRQRNDDDDDDVAEFSNDDEDETAPLGSSRPPPPPPPLQSSTATGGAVFSVAPDGAWVNISKPCGSRQHKKERGVPSLTMRYAGFYDLAVVPRHWPSDVDPAYIYDNDAFALLVLSQTAHGALRFRAGQPIGSSTRSTNADAVRFVYERAAWPVFVGNVGGGVRRLFMPTDAVVTWAEKVRQMRFTQLGLNAKEVSAYWPTDARSLGDFNRAERPDGSSFWLVSAQTLDRNQLLSRRIPKLPKGVSGAAELASDSRDALYRRFPAWYMPTVDRIEVFKFYITTSSPELLRELMRTRVNANDCEIQKKYTE